MRLGTRPQTDPPVKPLVSSGVESRPCNSDQEHDLREETFALCSTVIRLLVVRDVVRLAVFVYVKPLLVYMNRVIEVVKIERRLFTYSKNTVVRIA